MFKSSSGYLGPEVHKIAMDKLWLWLVGELQPKEVWLAESWAGNTRNCEPIRAGETKYPNIEWKTTSHPSSGKLWMQKKVHTT